MSHAQVERPRRVFLEDRCLFCGDNAKRLGKAEHVGDNVKVSMIRKVKGDTENPVIRKKEININFSTAQKREIRSDDLIFHCSSCKGVYGIDSRTGRRFVLKEGRIAKPAIPGVSGIH